MTDDRNYIAEMRVLCVEAIADTEQPNEATAADVVAKLLANDPDLLTGWLLAKAQSVVSTYLRQIDASGRSHTRAVAAGAAFADAVTRYEAGDPGAFSAFEVRYVVSDEGARRRVADMRGSDHTFVAAAYAASAKRDKLFESVHRAVAKKVGARTTSEVFTEAEYVAMFGQAPKPQPTRKPAEEAA